MSTDPTNREPVLMGAQQAADELFGGTRRAWDLLNAAKKRQLPSVRIGGRVFFSPEAIREWIRQQSAASLQMEDETSSGGIRRLK
ncbi:helix-turn-helix domain-containing protein [uncultured Anaeromusa sp.]|uniref:helix-turn-helix domain-containing protein n=1 Tax=uncultured Anaeromusa sp. TaxID=673273 RepID=UPI0029C67C9C|nr:helix-turn-helix domain-containing protein [uncultured Anaeromusa sp.]